MSKIRTPSTSAPILWPTGRDLPDRWSMVPFERVAKLVKRREAVEPERNYALLGMRWYAKGPYVKEQLPGTNIKATHVYKVAKGDFIYNRLFAWKGSFGVVDENCAHGYVSGEFPVFETAQEFDAYYLWFLFSQPWVWAMLENRSAGTTSTSRLRLKEEDLAKFVIPIPNDRDRKQLVEDVRTTFARIALAREAAVQQLEAVESLPLSVIRRAFNGVL